MRNKLLGFDEGGDARGEEVGAGAGQLRGVVDQVEPEGGGVAFLFLQFVHRIEEAGVEARTLPVPGILRSLADFSERMRKVSAPRASTILLA
jgi:hypothetical protein